MKELVLGVGHKRVKELWQKGMDNQYQDPVFVDIDPDCNPDVLLDLRDPLPFADNLFDEIHAYEVLEHIGRQGDWEGFFREFSEYWRVLKPDGLLIGHVPWWQSPWAWGDPGHTRVIQPETLNFLAQSHYKQVDEQSSCSTDYRAFYKADFVPLKLEHHSNEGPAGGHLYFVLQAKKGDPEGSPTD